MEKQIKYTKPLIITIAVLVCLGQALLGMEETQTFVENFDQLPPEMQQEITSNLSDKDLARLAQTRGQTSVALAVELIQRWERKWENRIKIDFSKQRLSYSTFDQFWYEILNRLWLIGQQYPEQWISLDLSNNNLGLISSRNLKEFIQSLAEFPIVELSLCNNQLISLPEGSFNGGFNKLQVLDLRFNRLSILAENTFNGLLNLQVLSLSFNNLNTLTENTFKGLPNLQKLYLDNNQLSSLPEEIFNELPNLQVLYLFNNQLSFLPANIFNGCNKLQLLDLDNNQLSSLPEGIYGLYNLGWLYLSNNLFIPFPENIENIFNGLPNLQELYCDTVNNQ